MATFVGTLVGCTKHLSILCCISSVLMWTEPSSTSLFNLRRCSFSTWRSRGSVSAKILQYSCSTEAPSDRLQGDQEIETSFSCVRSIFIYRKATGKGRKSLNIQFIKFRYYNTTETAVVSTDRVDRSDVICH